jgi:hypothetical protein
MSDATSSLSNQTDGQMDGQIGEVIVRPVNPDNEVELGKLCRLFQAYYRGRYPSVGIYDTHFWRNRIGQGAISFVAVIDGDVIAHVSAERSSDSPGLMTVGLFAAAPGVEILSLISSKLAAAVVNQGKRWKCASALGYCLAGTPEAEQFYLEEFAAKEVGILPQYVRDTQGSTPVLLLHRILDDQKVVPSRVFVAEQDKWLVSSLHANARIVRTFADWDFVPANHQIKTEPMRETNWRKLHVTQFIVKPSSLSALDMEELVTRAAEPDSYYFVSLEDPMAGPFRTEIGVRDMVCCGVIPNIYGGEHMVLCHEAIARQSAATLKEGFTNSQTARELADHFSRAGQDLKALKSTVTKTKAVAARR